MIKNDNFIYKMSKSKLTLKEFLKMYTAISNTFIDEYFVFYEKCIDEPFGIDVQDVMKYLDIEDSKHFIERFKKKYKKNIDYITSNKNVKATTGVRMIDYYMTFDIFQHICMKSTTKK